MTPTQRLTRRSSNTKSYIQHQTRTDSYKFSFVPRTTRDWNDLPSNITSIEDHNQFKETVLKHLKA